MTIELTAEAAQHLATDLDGRLLRIAFTTGCGGSGYRLSYADAPNDGDEIVSVDGVRVALDDMSASKLDGAVISIRVTASSQPGAITNKVHIASLGSTDLQPNNDDAAGSVTIYDPARCTAAAPVLLEPAEDAVLDAQPAHFAWTASADGARYV